MKIVSLFAGCGGLDLGFENAGFDVIWANEYDPTIHATYRLNHPNTTFCGSDIRSLRSEEIPDCDGIIGGPPCQSWSVGGRGLGIEDERGRLFFDYIRIVEEKRPKFFLLENVAGILDEKHLPAFNLFLERFKQAGYKVTFSLLNTAFYAIPQDRFRVFVAGIRDDINVEYTFPAPHENQFVTLRQAIGDIADAPQFSNGPILHPVNEHGLWNHDVYDGPYSANYMHSNRVRAWDEQSFTIQAQASNAPLHPQAPKMVWSKKTGREFVKGCEHLYRRLSVRECARVQTFPDSFHFIYNDVKDGYKMVGNAVPPRMAFFLALQFKKIFSFDKKQTQDDTLPVSSVNAGILTENDVLVGLVKKDYQQHFLRQSAGIYYTGKSFPSTIPLTTMKFFMPYIKGKGIRDLYSIKSVRKGSKSEVSLQSKDTDERILFDIEFVKQIFDVYLPLHLNIWYSFTVTSLEKLNLLCEDLSQRD